MKYKFHAVCDLFPRHTEYELLALTDDIRSNGLRRPIIRFGGKIIDGQGRLEACERAGVAPFFLEYHPKATQHEQIELELLAVSVSENQNRRHMTIGQKAITAAKIADFQQGRPSKTNPHSCGFTQHEAAKTMGVSERTVQNAAAVIESGTPALQEAVSSGDVTVTDAAKIVKEPAKIQNAAVKAVRKKKSRTVTAAVAEVKAEREPGDEEDEPLVKDHFKVPVPAELAEVFTHCEEFRSVMAAISDCKSRCGALACTPAGGWLDIQEIERMLTDARHALRYGQPYTECPKCRRKPKKACPACKGTGWVHESMYKQSSSDEDKLWVTEGRS